MPAEPHKTYTPHCTILHRCGQETGCCFLDHQTCVMKRQQTVELYFIVSTVGSDHETYERRSFENHTECECVDRVQDSWNRQLDQLPPNPLLNCDCPAEYVGRVGGDGACQCDCDAYNHMCRDLKFGLQSFSIKDRL